MASNPLNLPGLDDWADIETLGQSIQSAALAVSAAVVKTGNTFALTAALFDAPCSIRFIAPASYTKGDTISINGTGYTLAMTNGKPLGNNAWVSGAVVCLQVNPTEKKAFFSGGGADLSFITAGANQIMSGFVGANKDGEPVAGTRTARVQKIVLNSRHIHVGSDSSAKIEYKIPFSCDLLILSGTLRDDYETFARYPEGGGFWTTDHFYYNQPQH